MAGRLAEQRHRPAFIFEEGPEFSRASCRSIAEFDIAAALRNCDDLLVRHGGHAMAAGFTTYTRNLPALKDRLAQQATEQLADVDLRPRINIDAQAPLDRVEASQVSWLQRFAPFGEGNPIPTFMSRDVLISDARRVGTDGAHLRLKLRCGNRTWPGDRVRSRPGAMCEWRPRRYRLVAQAQWAQRHH